MIVYPDFKPISLEDKKLFERYLKVLNPQMCELTFGGLFLFRNAHSYNYTILNDNLIILGESYSRDETYFLQPLGVQNLEATISKLFRDFPNLKLYCEKDWAEKNLNLAKFEGKQDIDNWDYVYLKEELQDLSGRKFHSQKNKVNSFLKRCPSAKFASLDETYIEGSIKIDSDWCLERCDLSIPSTYEETAACTEGLKYFSELGFIGGVVTIDDVVEGFSYGEMLNEDTFVIHCEKARPHIEGLPQFLDMEFIKSLSNQVIYINKEQDLGDLGLREAKARYHPVKMIEKFKLKLKTT